MGLALGPVAPDALKADRDSYAVAFLDWLACACAGADERAPRAVRASGSDLLTEVAFAATAGHVLDFDDTFSDGVAHVSATCAPAALVLAAHLGHSLGAMLEAYAEGYEVTAALAEASHPALYDAGWHPTAVCGSAGAAAAAAFLLDLSPAQRDTAVNISLLRAGGTRGAFGTDGKSLQVGMAAAAGVQAALLTRGGATVDPRAIHGPLGFDEVMGASWPRATAADPLTGAPRRPAIERNWIKLYPSCLGTHSPIEAAERARADGYRLDRQRLEVVVHPVGRQAAHLDMVSDGLSAKFSIPYCVAFTLTHGPPRLRDFLTVEAGIREQVPLIDVVLDRSLPQFGAILSTGETELARVQCPKGTPDRPLAASELAGKVTDLAGERLRGVLDDLEAPAVDALDAAGLRPAETGVAI